MSTAILILSLVCVSFVVTEKVSYRAHKVLRIQPKDVEQLTFLKSLVDEYDFWKDPINLKQPVDVRVSPKQFVVLKTKLMKRAIPYSVMIEDVETAIQQQFSEKKVADETRTYRAHKVLRIEPKDAEQLTFLKSVENEYDFWMSPVNLKQPVDVRVSPKQFVVLKTKLMKRAIPYSVMVEDVETEIQQQFRARKVNGHTSTYRAHKVLRIQPKDVEQLTFLKSVESEYDFWKDPVNLKQPVDVRVSPKQFVVLKTKLVKRAIEYSVLIEDVEKVLQKQSTDTRSLTFFEEYNPLEEINTYVAGLPELYPDWVELVTMPELSFEGREITVVKVSTGGAGKPGFWFDGGIHAREWVSPAVVLYMLNQMLTMYGADDDVTSMMDAFDWYILPVFNVDGYEYTWTGERLWRKTRSTNEGSTCIGTDPNRNWDFEWGTVGVSHLPCADTYCGSEPFSEIEVKTVVNYLESLSNMQGYLAYHSYGQMYMVPWGYTSDPRPEDYDELLEVCQKAEEAIESVHGTPYVCDQLINLVGPSSGSSADYTYAVANIKYSYGVELRDTGNSGFLLPEDQITPTAEESFAGLKAFAQQILTRIPPQEN